MSGSFEAEARETIARCFPLLTQEELSIALEAFLSYIDLANGIHDLLQADPERLAAACALTAISPRATFEAGHVEPTNQNQPSLHA